MTTIRDVITDLVHGLAEDIQVANDDNKDYMSLDDVEIQDKIDIAIADIVEIMGRAIDE